MSNPEHKDKPVYSLAQMGSFEQFFKKEYPFVCQIIHIYVNDHARVEDIAQELFAELWVKREAVFIHTSVQAYLRRMAVSRALNYLRDTRKYNWDELDAANENVQNATFQDPSVIQNMEESELRKIIDEAIGKLPEKCRIVFLLSRHEELSYGEISRQLNISVKTVENQIGKALKLLKLALAGRRG